MKHVVSILPVISFITLVQYVPTLTNAEQMVRVIFNNGIEPSSNEICNFDDNTILDRLFNESATSIDKLFVDYEDIIDDDNNNVRHLRERQSTHRTSASSSSYSQKNLTDQQRQQIQNDHRRFLAPIYCRNNCLGYVTSTCRATNCKGYRRKRQMQQYIPSLSQHHHHRQRQLNHYFGSEYFGIKIPNPLNITCPGRIKYINDTISRLSSLNIFSKGCMNLLRKPLQFECFDDIVYGEIVSVNVIDASKRILNQPGKVLTICKGTSNKIEVKINECVEKVTYKFYWGNSIKTISGLSKALFSGDKFYMDTKYLLPYNYTAIYIPDGFVERNKTLRLNVKNC